MAQAYQLIQAVTVGAGGAASIDFTNIPATYTDLKLVLSGRLSVTDIGVYMYFNSDTTAANYSFRNVYGNGANTFSINSSAEAVGTYLNESGYTASTFGSSDIYIPNYTSSNKKSFSTDTTTENNATTSYAVLLSGLWSGTSAITGIKLQPRTSGNFVQYSTAYLYGVGGARATGGTITADSTYTYHTFTSSGTFTALENIKGAEVLLVAGGGSGGSTLGGGGGAGGLLYTAGQTLIAGTSYSAIVGAGASSPASQTAGSQGSGSQFGSLTAVGGGYGGRNPTSGGTGGSGGGGYYTGTGGSATSGQGNTGGAGHSSENSGGGGGAGAIGGAGTASVGGAGGSGSSAYHAWHFATNTGVSVGGTYFIAGGGGGGIYYPYTPGTGGNGGGGTANAPSSGANQYASGTSGTANTGGGGGGSSYGGNVAGVGGTGGSGLVIIRYPN